MPQGLLPLGHYTLSYVHDSPVTETCVKQGSNIHCATSASRFYQIFLYMKEWCLK